MALLVSLALLTQAPLQFQFPSDGERPGSQTLFYREGPLATTKVFRDPQSGEQNISVDGIVIGGTGNSEFKQLLLAHLPKLLLDDVSQELSVGVGSGILLGESALHPRVEKITGVETEPSVNDGAAWFADENRRVLENPRVDLTSADAIIPHYVAGDSVIRAAVGDDPVNSLDRPGYEFYYPWDYARERDTQFIANHALTTEMKLASFPGFLNSQQLDGPAGTNGPMPCTPCSPAIDQNFSHTGVTCAGSFANTPSSPHCLPGS